MQELKKTSQDWYNIVRVNKPLVIMDPDGWDRKNYQYSFHVELITLEEFNSRVDQSTCIIIPVKKKKKEDLNVGWRLAKKQTSSEFVGMKACTDILCLACNEPYYITEENTSIQICQKCLKWIGDNRKNEINYTNIKNVYPIDDFYDGPLKTYTGEWEQSYHYKRYDFTLFKYAMWLFDPDDDEINGIIGTEPSLKTGWKKRKP